MCRHVLRSACAVLAISSPSLARDLPSLEYGVSNPFPTADSIVRLRVYVATESAKAGHQENLPDNVWPILPRISYWGYKFDTPSNSVGRVYFIQKYTMDELLAEAQAALKSMDQNGCSFAHAGQMTFSVTPHAINFSAPITGKKRTCGWLPVIGDYATDLGDIGGTASGTIGIQVVPSSDVDKFRGTVDPTDIHISASVEAQSIFGINVNSVAGQLVKSVAQITSLPILVPLSFTSGEIPVWSAFSTAERMFDAEGGSTSVAAQYLLDSGGKVNQKAYSTFLGQLNDLTWSTQAYWVMSPTLTHFDFDDGHLTLTVTFTADVNDDDGSLDAAKESADEETRVLAGFSKGNSNVVARRGDSWWRLAKANYGNGYFAGALAAHQGLRLSSKIAVGQKIVIVPLDQLGQLSGQYVVKPGDNLRIICSRISMPDDLHKCEKHLVQKNPGIRAHLFALGVLDVS